MAEKEKEDLTAEGLVAHSYTGFFKIRKRIRRFQDLVIPLREGLGVDQLVTFLLGLIVMGILYGLFVSPLVGILNLKLTFAFFLVWFLGPAILAAQQISKPMPSGKTISGFVASSIRSMMDDPVHRRGVPLASKPREGKVFHYQREFVTHPTFAADALTPVPDAADDAGLFYSGDPVDLEDFMANRASIHSERQQVKEMAAREQEQVATRKFLLAPRAQVIMDDEMADSVAGR